MKYLKLLALILGIGILLQSYGYLNSVVSYKYEVDLMTTNIETSESLSPVERKTLMIQVKNRSSEIAKFQRQLKITLGLSVLSLIILFMIFRKNTERDYKSDERDV
jgi:hypothetical protein